MKIDH